MVKPVSIALWFLLFMFCFTAALFAVPDKYRVHPKLAKPAMFIRSARVPATNNSLCLVGDSQARIAPWEFFKIACVGQTTNPLIKAIKKADIPAECNRFVLLFGTVLEGKGFTPAEIEFEMERVKTAIRKRRPDATINSIPHTAILRIAETYTVGDFRHPNEEGWEILRSQYAHYF